MMMLLCWVMCLIAFAAMTTGQTNSPFADPVETSHNVEYYDNGDTRFAIYTTPVTWKEASKLCPAKGGNLLELSSDEISAFIGRALAESVIGYGSLWVGGEYTTPTTQGGEGKWAWIRSGSIIAAKFIEEIAFPMTTLPYWVDRPNITTTAPMCLATARKMHHLALIVGQPCHMKRPYICALPGSGDAGNGTIGEVKPPINIGNKIFHIFKAEVTWTEALTQCESLGMVLAKLTTKMEFKIAGNRMMRARPIMENAWIGGFYTNNAWTWISSNELINVNLSKSSSNEPFAWYRPDNIIMEGCLLADRHVCDHFVYVEARCDRRRNFICEEESNIAENQKLVPVPEAPGLWMSTFGDTWFRAQNICKICLGGELMQLDTDKEGLAMQLPYLFNAMAITLRQEVRHIWVGGYLFNNTFKWTHDSSLEPQGDDHTIEEELFNEVSTRGEKGTISYCAANFEEESYLLGYKCLNLDRENQKNFFLYGLACFMKQYFLCHASLDAKLAATCLTGENTSTSTEPTTTSPTTPSTTTIAPTTTPSTTTYSPTYTTISPTHGTEESDTPSITTIAPTTTVSATAGSP